MDDDMDDDDDDDSVLETAVVQEVEKQMSMVSIP